MTLSEPVELSIDEGERAPLVEEPAGTAGQGGMSSGPLELDPPSPQPPGAECVATVPREQIVTYRLRRSEATERLLLQVTVTDDGCYNSESALENYAPEIQEVD
jgi:hypothetical protein